VNWLTAYTWPGNVRELQNLMERAVLLSGGKPIKPAHFLLESEEWPLFADADMDGETQISPPQPAADGDHMDTAPEPASDDAAPFAGGVIPLHEMERIMIQKGLEQTSGNRTQAAELLGISVRTLRNKLNEYRQAGIEVE
jgi:Response regulator containing CheY-like receiver, AAA-type ATPase, and DNA-binding domains